MNDKSKYSIYPSNLARVGMHILYWSILYLFMLFYYSVFTNIKLFTASNMVLSFSILLITIIIHYFIICFTYPKILNGRLLLVVFHLFLLYLLAAFYTPISLKYLYEYFPENTKVATFHKVFYTDNILSRMLLFWILDLTIWYCLLGIVIKLIKDFYEDWQDKIAIIKERNRMEINFLRTQIHPHFLFNALNNIYGLLIENEKAVEMIIQLSAFLRFALYSGSKKEISLSEEKEYLINYLQLEKIRFEKTKIRIEYDFNQIDNPDAKIKPLILVAILENTFKQILKSNIENSCVDIVLREKDGFLVLQINNKKNDLFNNLATVGDIEETALYKIQRRLDFEYPQRNALYVEEKGTISETLCEIKL